MNTKNNVNGSVDVEQVEKWLDINDPKDPKPQQSTSSEFSEELKLQSDTTKEAEWMVSTGVLIGERKEEVLEKSRILQDRLNNRDIEGVRESLADQPTDGLSSVAGIARSAAGLGEELGNVEENIEGFNKYISILASSPFFIPEFVDIQNISRDGRDYREFIDETINLFESVKSDARETIRSSISTLANAAASRVGEYQGTSLFVQNTINAAGPDDNDILSIYYSSIVMQSDERKGATSFQEDFTLARTRLRFRNDMWPAFSRMVMEKEINTVYNWLDQVNTRRGSKEVNLCIDS